METFVQILEYTTAFAFAALGLMTFQRWIHRKDPSAMWAFVTFASLGFVAVLGIFLPDDSDWAVFLWVTKALVVIIVLFPYFLYRISASFRRKRTWIDRVAGIATGAVIGWTLLLPEFPGEGEPQSTQFKLYVLALLVVWV